MNVRGQNLNRNTVKQTAENGQKILDDDIAGIASWCQASRIHRAEEWYWIRPGIIRLLRQVAYDMIPADHEHFESLA